MWVCSNCAPKKYEYCFEGSVPDQYKDVRYGSSTSSCLWEQVRQTSLLLGTVQPLLVVYFFIVVCQKHLLLVVYKPSPSDLDIGSFKNPSGWGLQNRVLGPSNVTLIERYQLRKDAVPLGDVFSLYQLDLDQQIWSIEGYIASGKFYFALALFWRQRIFFPGRVGKLARIGISWARAFIFCIAAPSGWVGL